MRPTFLLHFVHGTYHEAQHTAQQKNGISVTAENSYPENFFDPIAMQLLCNEILLS